MAQTSLIQLSVVLCLTILCATEAWSQNIPQGNGVSLQRLVSSTKCSLGPLQLSISCTRMGLRDVPPDLYPGVEELDLSYNDIELLSNTSFTPYPSIIKLSLFFNNLLEIAPGSFYSLPELQYLDLGDNAMLDMITSDMFRLSKKLTHLSVSGSNLDDIPSDILQWLPALQLLDLRDLGLLSINISSCNSAIHNLTVDLGRNRFQALTSNTFRIDCQLDFLNLNHCRDFIFAVEPVAITTIRSRSLSLGHTHLSPEVWPYFFTGIGDSEIRELLLSNTNLGDIDPRNFSLLQGKLKVLDLSNNELSSDFAKMGFFNLPFLSTLILNRCTIHDIDPTYFSRMKGLRVLQLNHNNIINIGDINSNSSWDIDLEELHLAYNSLEKIHERSLMGLGKLTKLVLRGNKDLYKVWISAITGLNNLKYLDLSGCLLYFVKFDVPKLETFLYSNCKRLESMESIREAFSTRSIRHVFLGNSSINSLWTPYTSNNISLFEGMRNLTTLDVKRNQIKLLQDGLFLDLEHLMLLDLSNCQIEVIEKNAFEGLDRLHTLYLQGNRLQYLPNKVLMNAGQLHNIRLDGNKIRYLGKDLFVNKSKLQNLTLADNRLTVVNLSTFQPIYNSLSLIDISTNELGCTCDLKWLPKWLGGSITVVNENDTRCSLASITEMRGKPVMSFNPADFCGPNIALYCSLPFVITWIVVMGIFAYRHRWFLKYKLFLLKLAVVGYQEIQDARDLDDFEFHFNIMFAEEDEEWVRNHLRPVLEEQLPEYNRNVYGDNNLPLGMHYCDAVHYVVEMSYKTIVLVSRVAIQDNWFVIKFRTAADQVNDTQIENMVVIFLEDIPDDELPFLVRLYLSDRKPYLGWEEEDDEEFQEYFWQKLIKMLTINLRCNNVIPPE